MQEIAEDAYADFVEALKEAGYDVVEQGELTRLAPDYTTWTAVPSFTEGSFGSSVAPKRSVYFWMGASAKRDLFGN